LDESIWWYSLMLERDRPPSIEDVGGSVAIEMSQPGATLHERFSQPCWDVGRRLGRLGPWCSGLLLYCVHR